MSLRLEPPANEDQGTQDRQRISWRLAALVALIVVLAVVPIAVLVVTRPPPGPRYMTMTEFYDLATDTDSGLNWSTLPNGTEVHVQDRIVDLHTDFSALAEIDFPYTGTKIPWLTYTYAFSTDNLCAYGINDIVRLDGTVEVETWGPFAGFHAVPLWRLEGGSPPVPDVTLGPRQVLSSEVRFPVTSVSEACRGLHFRAQLWQHNGSVDGIFLRWDGIRGIYLRYDDADGSGTVTPGDLIRIVDPPSGPLELHLYFKGDLLASSAWTSP